MKPIAAFARYVPFVLLNLLMLAICFANWHQGEMFIGWDSVNAELNPWLNIMRSIHAGWQEYYGVGLLGGHGFAALLPVSLLALLGSSVLPLWAVRTVISLGLVYAGVVGMYLLVSRVLKRLIPGAHARLPHAAEWIALFSALVYLFNQGSAEQLFTQTEAFTFHFAALPWLFLTSLIFLETPNRRNAFLVVAAQLMFSTQGFVPPVFLAYVISLLLFVAGFTALSPRKRAAAKASCILLALILAANSYWIIPFGVNQASQKETFLESYNNLLQTPEFIQKNSKFGAWENVALLKGFFWDSKMFDEFILLPWKYHFSSGVVPAIGYGVFLVSLAGLGSAFLGRNRRIGLAFASVYLLYFGNLATEIPPFSYALSFLRSVSPSFRQAFRNPFTKFSIGAGFSYSLFFGIGTLFILIALYRLKRMRVNPYTLYAVLLGLLVYAGIPIIQGHLFYTRLFVKLPPAYTDTVSFFNRQSDGRIADFPQECPEGWYHYSWGYVGSGFLWYGIKQPVLSRTFDVWHNANENYYWETIQALRENDYKRFADVMRKYDVRWIMYDGNLKHCRNQRTILQNEDFRQYLRTSPEYTRRFASTRGTNDPIEVYELNSYAGSYVTTARSVPNILPSYRFTDYDTAADDTPVYSNDPARTPDVVIPFRSLFDKRNPGEKDFEIAHAGNRVTLKTTFQLAGPLDTVLHVPPYAHMESVIPVYLTVSAANGNGARLFARLALPRLFINGNETVRNKAEFALGTLPKTTGDMLLTVNENEYRITPNSSILTYFYTNVGNSISFNTGSSAPIPVWGDKEDEIFKRFVNEEYSYPVTLEKQNEVRIELPTFADNTAMGSRMRNGLVRHLNAPCSNGPATTENRNEVAFPEEENEYLRLISANNDQCLTLSFPTLQTDIGYIMDITTRNGSGLPLRVNLLNSKGAYYLMSDLDPHRQFETSSFIIPPSYKDAVGYEALIQNRSLSYQETVNDIRSVGFTFLPYRFIKSLRFGRPPQAEIASTGAVEVAHPLPFLYEAAVNDSLTPDGLLVLYQSYHPGWTAYAVPDRSIRTRLFPFLFGTKLTGHQTVNNWANGWQVEQLPDGNKHVMIVFWPQYLQYAGFCALFLAAGGILFMKRK